MVAPTDGGPLMGANDMAGHTHIAEVNARDFGLMGDGTDETVQFQRFVDYLCANRRMGVLPATEYRVSATDNFPAAEGWAPRPATSSTPTPAIAALASFLSLGRGFLRWVRCIPAMLPNRCKITRHHRVAFFI